MSSISDSENMEVLNNNSDYIARTSAGLRAVS